MYLYNPQYNRFLLKGNSRRGAETACRIEKKAYVKIT